MSIFLCDDNMGKYPETNDMSGPFSRGDIGNGEYGP